MGRRRAAQNCDIKPWASAQLDNKEKRFSQIGNSLLESAYFQEKLHHGARWLYICMLMESSGRKAFRFPLAAAEKYGIAQRSFRRDVEVLVEKKFIRRYSGKNVRQPNDYEFIPDWKIDAQGYEKKHGKK